MSDIHRLLDEAFAGATMTPELQDLKEELRGNLLARAAELEGRGMDAPKAARSAVAELGDIHELIVSVDGAAPDSRPALGAAAAEAARLHRVRPKPGFVVRASLLSIVIAASAVLLVLLATRLLAGPAALALPIAAVFGLAIFGVTADALRQETAQHYRMPVPRSLGYGLGGGLLGSGLGLLGLVLGHLAPSGGDLDTGGLVASIVITLAGIVALIALGVTQTNRSKPWALAQQRQYEADDRFSQDPVAAARFGIYTVIIWTVAIALFVALSIAVGFVWSWLALVAGVVVFFLVLTRMLFAPDRSKK